jgi:hypothetical protein
LFIIFIIIFNGLLISAAEAEEGNSFASRQLMGTRVNLEMRPYIKLVDEKIEFVYPLSCQ